MSATTAMEKGLENLFDELFEVAPEEFTSRRNEIARSLKKSGDEQGTERVMALKRPTLPQWAVNQLSRHHPHTVDRLIDVQRSLADAKDPKTLQELGRRRRKLVTELTDRARTILGEPGRSVSAQMVERVTRTLLAVNTPEEEELLRRGHLESELQSSGFDDAFAGLSVETVRAEGPSAEERAQAVAETETLEAEAREARQHARALTREADRLRSEADTAERKAASARRRAEELANRAREAREALDA